MRQLVQYASRAASAARNGRGLSNPVPHAADSYFAELGKVRLVRSWRRKGLRAEKVAKRSKRQLLHTRDNDVDDFDAVSPAKRSKTKRLNLPTLTKSERAQHLEQPLDTPQTREIFQSQQEVQHTFEESSQQFDQQQSRQETYSPQATETKTETQMQMQNLQNIVQTPASKNDAHAITNVNVNGNKVTIEQPDQQSEETASSAYGLSIFWLFTLLPGVFFVLTQLVI